MSNVAEMKPDQLGELYQNSQTLTHAACRPTGTSIPKTYGSPMGYRGRAQARTVPRMSQCLRSLVLHASAISVLRGR